MEYEFVSGTKGKEIEGVLDHLKPVHKGTYYYYYRNLKEYSETKIVAEQPKQTTFYDSTKKERGHSFHMMYQKNFLVSGILMDGI